MHEINYIVCKRYFKYALKFLKGDINPLIHKTVRHYNIAVIGLGYVIGVGEKNPGTRDIVPQILRDRDHPETRRQGRRQGGGGR